MKEKQLLQGFEAATLPVFSHRDHLRVAWLLLRRLPFEEGARRFVVGLKSLAAAHGVPEKFHQTITWASLVLIGERLAAPGAVELDFEAFTLRNADLLDRSMLTLIYDASVLQSELARRVFVLPRDASSKVP